MAVIDFQYQELLRKILREGYTYKDTKRDVNCKQISHYTLEVDMQRSFPLLTLKKMYWKGIVHELLWFLSGDPNIKYLHKNKVKIWHKDAYAYYKRLCANANQSPLSYKIWESMLNGGSTGTVIGETVYEFGDIGEAYGPNWREFGSQNVDQLRSVLLGIKQNTFNRRNIVSAWNPGSDVALPPCHWAWEIIPESEDSFILKWHQRSVDTFLGLPFNIASYALLGKILEVLLGMQCTKVIGDLSNVHLYENSIEAAEELLTRNPWQYASPRIDISWLAVNTLINFNFKDASSSIYIVEYHSYPPLKVEMLAPKE